MPIDRRSALALAALAPVAARASTAAPLPACLSANENPLGPGPNARAAIAASTADFSRYGGASLRQLRARIAGHENLPEDHVVIGAGSADILAAAATAFGMRGQRVVAPAPTFDHLQSVAKRLGGNIDPVPLLTDGDIDLAGLAAKADGAALVYLCNPNNPTAKLLKGDTLRRFAAGLKTPLFVDEAYMELTATPAADTLTDRVRAGDPVIVSRTFSKGHGLAGLRMGYALARPDLAKQLADARFSIFGAPQVAIAQAALADTAFLAAARISITTERARIEAALDALKLPRMESHANFVFFNSGRPVGALRKQLETDGVIIAERWTDTHPQWVRVSTGLPADVTRFIIALNRAYA
ncbi:pyridoxal phosphate-dependent aminotransferase [Sandaracinobacteroides saxicola]|uniref:Histidinol-phosphate aminotransferase family protein n=1 Tax=Sandaracinobacteroides saxicola TaxID=2759707 RepID=A0A7G5II04_9SPHN|nr:histidinol-phosphate transaminase [Sandaracinobacteroides saxicola]QMW22996.1 histidinol-phosphate aminotransferase family protein [Sandaracinobacteroides saxicola]